MSSASDAGPIRRGEELDWKSLEIYLRASLDVKGPMSVLQFPHGAANLTYLVNFGDTSMVLRRPPFGEIAPGAHDMRREGRVLSGLGNIWEKAPRCLLFCDDHDVIGSDFVVVEYIPGVVVRDAGIPAGLARHDKVAFRISMALVDATAELHSHDPDECGLGDLGRPAGFVERQVSGWWKRWQLVADSRLDELMGAVHARLAHTIPVAQRVSFVHGDLKLNNCVFDPEVPDTVRAVFDWDMTTIGDPLIDLGTLLNYWPGEGAIGQGSAEMLPELQGIGLATRAELVDRYQQRTGLSMDGINFYVAFAAFKTAVVAQQLFHRYAEGDSADDRLAVIGEQVGVMANVADAVLRLAESQPTGTSSDRLDET